MSDGFSSEFHGAVVLVHVVLDGRDGGDEVQVELALEPFAHDLHVQETEEAAAEAEAERGRGLRLVLETRVVQLELLERVAQFGIFVRLRRVKPGEDHAVDVLVAGELHLGVALGVEDGVADARLLDAADVGDDVADFAAAELVGLHLTELRVADLGDVVDRFAGAEGDLHARADGAIDDAHRGDRAAVAVVVRVEDERAQRRVGVAFGGRHGLHDALEELVDAEPFLGAHEEDVVGVGADQVVELLLAALGLGAGQIDLVQDGYDLEPRVEGEEEIGERLRLDPLARVDDEDRSFARGEGARDFVGEVDVSRRVDEIELVVAAVLGVVGHADGVELDRDARAHARGRGCRGPGPSSRASRSCRSSR